jgi:serine/threonine-protein kinase/endoribonuclease IRE1
VNNFFLFAAAIFFLPWLVEAQQQQRPAVPQRRHESPHESLDFEASHTLEPTKIPHPVETPLTHNRRKNTLSVTNLPPKNDASAIATLAPAASAVAAPSSRQPLVSGLSSSHIARSLEDWEVEDFVLLATVDGKLHARDRKTGKEKWSLEYHKPMVETNLTRNKPIPVDDDYDPVSIDDYLWIVEPSRDGSIYIYKPGGSNPGLVNTGLTMKRLVEESAYMSQDPPISYVGGKETNIITVDANNGKILNFFGKEGAFLNDEKCVASSGPVDSKEECPKTSTLTIGRTEYWVRISGVDGHHIATLTFSEWTPNNFDTDLQRQYHQSLDKKYILTNHNGGVFGFDLNRNEEEPERLFNHHFSSPVVRVFDVAKPWNAGRDSELVVLPQPSPPNREDEATANHRAGRIFLNHTESGSWYALSGKTYPWAVQGKVHAQCNERGWLQHRPQWDLMNRQQLHEALVGLHSIDNGRSEPLLSISAPTDDNQTVDPILDHSPSLIEEQDLLQKMRQWPRMAAKYGRDSTQNPVFIVMLVAIIFAYQKQIKGWVHRTGEKYMKLYSNLAEPRALLEAEEISTGAEKVDAKIPAVDGADEESEKAEKVQAAPVLEPDTLGLVPSKAKADNREEESPPPEGEKKKKAHRGRRGGVKHKKGRAASTDGGSQDGNVPKPQPTIDDAVKDAQNMGPQTKLEPDIITIPNDPQEVSGPIIRIASLEVNTDKLIGTGSNGTMVFEGKFDGREVAVKRMLIQFFDIASQETKLLRESDDHPNGMLSNLLLLKLH